MSFRSGLMAVSAGFALAACGAPEDDIAPPARTTLAASSDECVPIADGYYEFRDGRFLAVTTPPEALAASPAIWVQEIQSGLHEAGFPWLQLVIRDSVAVVLGNAPTADTRLRGFTTARSTINAHPRAGEAGLLILDGIAVEGGDTGPAEALGILAQRTITAENCEATFQATLQGREIIFESGNARISPVSLPLLDALSGTARLCQSFAIEIGNHTDSRGSDDYNFRLSRERAEAMRDHLAGKGVPAEILTPVGYGESRLIDPGQTAEAHARNRRTEFKVGPRS